jgi:hypothetical protein
VEAPAAVTEQAGVVDVLAHPRHAAGQLGEGFRADAVRRELGDDRLKRHAGHQDLLIGRMVELHHQLQGAGQVRGGRVHQDGAAARARLERDDALELQQPQCLAQRAAAGLVGLQHGPLGRQQVSRAQTRAPDVAHDPLRHQHRGLRWPAAGHRGATVVRRGARSLRSRHRTSRERRQGQVKMRRSPRLQRYET